MCLTPLTTAPLRPNIIKSIYAGTFNSLIYKGSLSPKFPSNIGVKQGGTLSTILFNLYFNDLARILSFDRNHPITLNNKEIPRLRYHVSDTTSPIPRLRYHVSDTTSPIPRLRYHVSDTTSPIPRLRYHVSDTTSPIPRLRYHVSDTTSPIPRLRYHVSDTLMILL